MNRVDATGVRCALDGRDGETWQVLRALNLYVDSVLTSQTFTIPPALVERIRGQVLDQKPKWSLDNVRLIVVCSNRQIVDFQLQTGFKGNHAPAKSIGRETFALLGCIQRFVPQVVGDDKKQKPRYVRVPYFPVDETTRVRKANSEPHFMSLDVTNALPRKKVDLPSGGSAPAAATHDAPSLGPAEAAALGGSGIAALLGSGLVVFGLQKIPAPKLLS